MQKRRPLAIDLQATQGLGRGELGLRPGYAWRKDKRD